MARPSDAHRRKHRPQRGQLPLAFTPEPHELTERDLQKAWRHSAFSELGMGFDEVMACDYLAKCLRLYAVARLRRRTPKGAKPCA